MAPVDSLLKLFVEHGASELRLAAGELPRMSSYGKPVKLTLPLTSNETLLHLIGPLLTDERKARIEAGGAAELDYQPEGLRSRFHVTLKPRAAGGLEALFKVGARPSPASEVSSHAASPPEPPDEPAPAPPRPHGPHAPHAPHAVVASDGLYAPTHGAAPLLPAAPMPGGPALPAADLEVAGPPLATDSPLGALLAEARAARASDLHLQSGAPPVARVDGALRRLSSAPLGPLEPLLAELPLGAEAVRAALAGLRALDGTFDFEDRRVRLHLYRAAEGPAAALRLLPGAAPSLASLHLPLDLADLALLPGGLVLVCGPTGSGKSATLAALAQEAVRRRGALLVTLEDPIEYRVQAGDRGLVRQRQVGRDVPDFPSGLRDALREDPDVLLLGELRDPVSVALALTAAETGHLVLASLHSRSASSAVERIVDAMPAGRREGEVRAQLAQSLRAVVAQRLLPRERGAGRVVALEVLRMNHNVAALVREGKTAQLPSALQSSRKEGMLLLEASLGDLVRTQAIGRDTAVAAANDPVLLAGYLDGK